MTDLASAARRAIACLDLTNLDDGADAAAIADLCARARTPHGPVAAICTWPRFVAEACRHLEGTPIRIATVVNFPGGDLATDHVLTMTRDTLADGADEIDMVIPWRALKLGDEAPVREAVAGLRAAAPAATLKTILETGMLEEPDLIRRAAEIAVEEGTDFLKTSTGKVAVNATLQSAEILLTVIAAAGRPVGLKPAGGVRTTEDAAAYLALADRIMGEGWAGPATFRLGASGVLTALLATLDGARVPEAGAGY